MQSYMADPGLYVVCTVSHMEPGLALPVMVGVILPCPSLLMSVVLIKFRSCNLASLLCWY